MAITPISFETHAKIRIKPLPSYSFAARTSIVPLGSGEIVTFCQQLPVILVPDGEDYSFAVLTSLAPNRNMLIDDTGQWHGFHIPGLWRRGPFRLGTVENSETERLVLCLDESSEQVNQTEGEPLFDEAGQPTAFLSGATALLSRLEGEFRNSRAVCKALKALNLVVPWVLETPRADGSKQQIDGLFRVDEAKLSQLTGDDLVALRDIGGLAMIYAHLFSLSKVSLLVRIAQQLDQLDKQREAVKSNKVDLDRAFGIVEDDPFIF